MDSQNQTTANEQHSLGLVRNSSPSRSPGIVVSYPVASSSERHAIDSDRARALAEQRLKPTTAASRPKVSITRRVRTMAFDGGRTLDAERGRRACHSPNRPGRNLFAAVLCACCVVLEVTAISVPFWLWREEKQIGTAVSSSFSIGLFSICERTFLKKCDDYFEASRDDSEIHPFMWDVRFQDKAQQLEAVRVCALISVILTLFSLLQNMLVPRRCRFKWLVCRSMNALLTFLLSAVSVITWFYWTEDELRQEPDESVLTRPSHGGRFRLSHSFYSMFAASLLIAVVAALDLIDVCRSPPNWRNVAGETDSLVGSSRESQSDHRLWLGQMFSVARVSDLPPPYTLQHNASTHRSQTCRQQSNRGNSREESSPQEFRVNVVSNHHQFQWLSSDGDCQGLLPAYVDDFDGEQGDPPSYSPLDSLSTNPLLSQSETQTDRIVRESSLPRTLLKDLEEDSAC